MSSPGPYGSSPYGSQPSAGDPYASQPYAGQPYASQPYVSQQPYAEPQGYGGGPNPYATSHPYLMPMVPAQRTNGLAVASLITSCTGVVLGITAPVGAILGIVALSQIKNDPGYTGRGMALAGIIVGAALTLIGVVLFVVYLVFVIALLGTTSY